MDTAAKLTSQQEEELVECPVPVIDISSLRGLVDGQPATEGDTALEAARQKTADEIFDACKHVGFFYITGHGVEPEHIASLEASSRVFFAQPSERKMRISMDKGGAAWRGYFRVGDELTSGLPDMKEGLYFGSELGPEAPAVAAGVPMHGANLWPRTAAGEEAAPTDEDSELRALVLRHVDLMTSLGHIVMEGIARALSLPPPFFRERFMQDPLCLFRIFNYPNPRPLAEQFTATGALLADAAAAPAAARVRPLWSVGEHTDYGMLTILYQDASGGLQVRRVSDGRWAPAPPVAGSFVVNIGDMLEKMTGGLFVSTPHRVLNPTAHGRISFPFFFDPSFGAKMVSIVGESDRLAAPRAANGSAATSYARWDGRPVGLRDFDGTYGQYVLGKVSKVFPQLAVQQKIEDSDAAKA